MQLYCDQERLAAALKAVLPAVPSRPLAVTDAGILLSSADGHLEVTATDREIAIRCRVGAQVAKPGHVVLPARTITDLVALLEAGERVAVELDEGTDTLTLQCARTQAHVRGWNADDFPPLPEPAGEPVARVEAETLRDGIGRVIYAAGADASRPALCGVLMHFDGPQVTLATADGFRLAEYTLPLAEPVAEPLDLVIPARGMRELSKFGEEGEVSITLDKGRHHAIFEAGDVVIAGQLAGKFPDYRQVIPQEWNVRVVAERVSLLQACRAAKAMHGERDILCIEVVPPDTLVVSASSALAGEGQTRVKAAALETRGLRDGLPIRMALNVRYFEDAVKATDGDLVSISTTAYEAEECCLVVRPVVVQPAGGDADGLCVIMPIQLS